MSKNTKLSLVLVALVSQAYAETNTNINLTPITVCAASKSQQSILDVTSNISVITEDEIEEKHYTTVTEAISSLSGINFKQNGGLGQQTSLFLRGQASDRVLVLIDGVRYNDVTSLNGAAIFEHLMISDIKQIEIIKGAQSGVWGANATAGVINIVTKKASKGVHGSANFEYGSFDTIKYGANVSYSTDSYYIKASSQKVDSNGFSAQATNGQDIDNFEKDGYRNTTSNIKLGFKINETNKIDISHTIINAHSEYDGYNAPNAYKTSRVQQDVSSINFNHIDSFNEFDLYVNKSTIDRDFPEEFTQSYDGNVLEYGAKSKINYREKDFIVVGGDYKTFEFLNSINKEYSNKALFLTNSNQFSCPLGGKIILTESLRSDHYSDFNNKTTGKIGLKRVFSNELFAKINYGTAYNIPTINNLYGPFGANPNLTPESTRSFDFLINYKGLQATYFKTDIKNMIGYTTGYVNLAGTSKIDGIELEYNKALSNEIFLSSNYTFLNAKNNNDETLAYRPKHSANITLDYYGFEDVHLGIHANYIGERYTSDNKMGTQTGKYTVINLSANYDLNNNTLLYAKVDNLFNKYYQIVDGYATAPLSAYAGIKIKF